MKIPAFKFQTEYVFLLRLLHINLISVASTLTAPCVCGRASRARPPHSRARCGWCRGAGLQLRSWLWTGTGPFPLRRCSPDLKSAEINRFEEKSKKKLVRHCKNHLKSLGCLETTFNQAEIMVSLSKRSRKRSRGSL